MSVLFDNTHCVPISANSSGAGSSRQFAGNPDILIFFSFMLSGILMDAMLSFSGAYDIGV
jgi:hypothetical protein